MKIHLILATASLVLLIESFPVLAKKGKINKDKLDANVTIPSEISEDSKDPLPP